MTDKALTKTPKREHDMRYHIEHEMDVIQLFMLTLLFILSKIIKLCTRKFIEVKFSLVMNMLTHEYQNIKNFVYYF